MSDDGFFGSGSAEVGSKEHLESVSVDKIAIDALGLVPWEAYAELRAKYEKALGGLREIHGCEENEHYDVGLSYIAMATKTLKDLGELDETP